MRIPLLAALVVFGAASLAAQNPIRLNTPPTACAANPASDTTVVSADVVDSPPVQLEVGRLRFELDRVPRDSTLTVRLRFVVNADGRPDSTTIVVADSPDTVLTAAARRALLDSRFWPACRDGVAVRTGLIEQRFRFRRQ